MPRNETKKRKRHQTPSQLANLKPIKPGEVRNPEGGRTHNPAIKALKKITIETFREVIEMVLTEDLKALKKVAEDEKTTALQVGIIMAFKKAVDSGDWETIEKIVSRIVGKIPEELNVNSKNINANLNTTLDREKVRAALADLESNI